LDFLELDRDLKARKRIKTVMFMLFSKLEKILMWWWKNRLKNTFKIYMTWHFLEKV